MDVVRLLGVKSKCGHIGNGWKELYNIRISINDIELDFDDDLRAGVLQATQNIFPLKDYSYRVFDSLYGREKKIKK